MSKPIRILQVLGRLDTGGAETMIMNLYENIDREQIQFDFVIHTEDECVYSSKVRNLGGVIYSVPSFTMKNIHKYKNAWRQLFIEHPEYKIIHGHVRSTASIYLKIANQYGLITIAHSHNTSSGKGLAAFVKNRMQYSIREIADYLFACSKESGVWLYGENACNGNNFYVLKNAIDTKKFAFSKEVRERVRKNLLLEDKLVLGHVGRFEQQKNHDFLMKVFHDINNLNKDARLILIGGGPLEGAIREKVCRLHLEEVVIFLGIRSDVNELLQAMDLFLLPSFFEGLPVTLIEAQAAGLPILVSNTITREVQVTELIEYLEIDNGVAQWSKAVSNIKKVKSREDSSIELGIMESGYSVSTTSKWLSQFYSKLYQSNSKQRYKEYENN
ncbi:MAG TPA: glycosyltransferase family 1 protein [Sedimentibacter sp.]|nr:glycosyltransferase family 1 protein [Sedimentibacter sp.]